MFKNASLYCFAFGFLYAMAAGCVEAPAENDERTGPRSGVEGTEATDDDGIGSDSGEGGTGGENDDASVGDDANTDDVGADDVGADDVGADDVSDSENAPPTFYATTLPEVFVHVPTTFQLSATDPEGQPVTFACSASCPSGLTVGASDGLVKWTPNLAGNQTLSFAANDGSVTTTVEIPVNVKGSWSAATTQTIEQLGFQSPESSLDWGNEVNDGAGTTYRVVSTLKVFDEWGDCSSYLYCPYDEYVLQKKVSESWVDLEVIARSNHFKGLFVIMESGKVLLVYSTQPVWFGPPDDTFFSGVFAISLSGGSASPVQNLSSTTFDFLVQSDSSGGVLVFFGSKSRRFNGASWFPEVNLSNQVLHTCAGQQGVVLAILQSNKSRLFDGITWQAARNTPTGASSGNCHFGPNNEPIAIWTAVDPNSGFNVLNYSVHSASGWSSPGRVTAPVPRNQSQIKAISSDFRLPLAWFEKLDDEPASVWVTTWNGAAWAPATRIDPDQPVASGPPDLVCDDDCRRIAVRWVEDTQVLIRVNE